MNGIIYKITNITNNKCYIGKTERTLEERWNEHQKDSKKIDFQNRPLYKAINKYGIENFSIEKLEEVDSEILSEREIYWILFYNSFSKGGYNATFGGEGKTLYSYEEIINKFLSGMLVKEIREELNCTKEVIESALQKVNINGKENNIKRRSIEVFQYDLQNNLIGRYTSINEAARKIIIDLNLSCKMTSVATNIGRVMNGKRKNCYGYNWKREIFDSNQKL